MPVRHADNAPADNVPAGEGTTCQVLIGANEAPNFAMRRFTMQPGGGIPPHTNAVEHEQYVLSGRATIGIGDQVIEIERDDVIYIPAGVRHWYRAEGDEPFIFICVVPNQPDKIELMKNTS